MDHDVDVLTLVVKLKTRTGALELTPIRALGYYIANSFFPKAFHVEESSGDHGHLLIWVDLG